MSDSVDIMAMLLRHFGAIMRMHAKLSQMRFIGTSPYFCTGVVLGKGSYANVFLGRHTKTAEVVAIKVMDWDRLTQGADKLRQALENEISIMRESNHPNIVRLYDALVRFPSAILSLHRSRLPCFDIKKREGCNLNLILEYCGGGSLEEYLQKRAPLSEQETRHWVHELGITITLTLNS